MENVLVISDLLQPPCVSLMLVEKAKKAAQNQRSGNLISQDQGRAELSCLRRYESQIIYHMAGPNATGILGNLEILGKNYGFGSVS